MNAQYDNDADEVAVGKEDEVARDLGEPVRLNHRGHFVVEADATEHTHTNSDGTAQWEEKGGKSLGPYVPGTTPIVAPSGVVNRSVTAPATEGWRSFDSGSESPVGQIGREMDAARAFVQQLQQKNQGGAERAAPALVSAVARDMQGRSRRNEGRD